MNIGIITKVDIILIVVTALVTLITLYETIKIVIFKYKKRNTRNSRKIHDLNYQILESFRVLTDSVPFVIIMVVLKWIGWGIADTYK